jgi:hypothetical protein
MHDEALLIDVVSYEDRKAKLKTYSDRLPLMMMPVVGKLIHGGVQ